MTQHGHGKGRIHRLVAPGQAGQRQVERAVFVAIMKLAAARDRIPDAASRKPDRAAFARNFTDARSDRRRIELSDQRHAGLGDRGFFRRNVDEAAAEELLVIQSEIRDCGDQRPLDDVRRVEASTLSDLENAGICRRACKSQQCDRGRDLEEARLDARPGVENFGKKLRKRLIVD
jgi:hypothetical protein